MDIHERDRRALAVFDEVVSLPPAEQEAAVAARCGSDAEVAAAVRDLLRRDAEAAGGVLDKPWVETRLRLDRLAEDAGLHADNGLPERIGRYRIRELLGDGASSIVYRAEEDEPRRGVAVKLLRWPTQREALRRFRREAATLARLKHPGIAQIYATGTTPGPLGEHPYLVIELVEGGRLDAFVQQFSPSLRRRIEIAIELCEAVEYAHLRGVIHRDLKPANIVMDRGGPDARPKILDFGIARLYEPDGPEQTMTREPQVIGTLAYMSPEQLAGDPLELDRRTDVYSLGVILYEMVAGRLPYVFHDATPAQQLQQMRTAVPVSLAVRVCAPYDDLPRVVARALAIEKELRYDSAAALAADLRAVLEQRPVSARPATLRYRIRKFAQRRRGLVLTAGGALLLALLGAGGTIYGLVHAARSAAALQVRLDHARESARFFVNEVAANLDTIAGTVEMRRAVLGRLERECRALMSDRPGDATLISTLAKVIECRSTIDLDEGRRTLAREQRLEALRLREQVVAASPGDLDARAALALAHVLVGDTMKADQDWEAAARCYRAAQEIDAELVRADPSNWMHAVRHAWGYIRLSELAMYRRQLDPALELIERAAQFFEALLEASGDSRKQTEAYDALDDVYGIRWEVFRQRGDAEATAHAATQRLRCARALHRMSAAQPRYALAHAAAAAAAADSAHNAGRIDECEQLSREALQIFEIMRALNPMDPTLIDGEFLARGVLAEARIELGEPLAAAEVLLSALPAQPGVACRAERHLGEWLCRAAEAATLQPQRLPKLARSWLRWSPPRLARMEPLAAPGGAQERAMRLEALDGLDDTYALLCEQALSRNWLERARDWATRRARCVRELHQIRPEERRYALARVFAAAAGVRVATRLRDFAAADEHATEALIISAAARRLDPGDTTAALAAVVAGHVYAEALLARGDPRGALCVLGIATSAAQPAPAHAGSRINLSVAEATARLHPLSPPTAADSVLAGWLSWHRDAGCRLGGAPPCAQSASPRAAFRRD